MVNLFKLTIPLLLFKISIATAYADYSNLSIPQIKYKDGILSGDCLLLVWDDCNCDQCENEL